MISPQLAAPVVDLFLRGAAAPEEVGSPRARPWPRWPPGEEAR